MAINKFIYNGETKFDLTGDTITPSDLAYGITAHDRSGAKITGTSTKDSDTSDATAGTADILNGKTAYVNGQKVTGNMTNNGSQNGTISTKAGSVTIRYGFHDGGGKVQISSTEQAKIIASNIKSGVVILGVTGTYSGAGVNAQAKTVTPSASAQTIIPDSGYDYLSQVTVRAIPYTERANSAGGTTITIG